MDTMGKMAGDVHDTRLENGVRVLLHRHGSVPVASLVVAVHAGSRHDPPGATGSAHLVEHLMFKGSSGVADGEHFRVLQEVGGSVNASTSHDHTLYYDTVPSEHLRTALALEGDRFRTFALTLTHDKVENQRSVVQNERRQNYDNQPYGLADETMGRAFFPAAHPYVNPIIGSMRDISAIPLETLRQFFRDRYAGPSLTVAVSGIFDEASTLAAIRDEFGPLSATQTMAQRPQPLPDAPPIRLVMEDQVTLPRAYLAWQGVRFADPAGPIFRVLSLLLGGGGASRLFAALVQHQGVALSAGSYNDSLEVEGIFGIETVATPGRSLGAVLDSLNAELQRFISDPPQEDEVRGAILRRQAQWLQGCSSSLGRAAGCATAAALTGDFAHFSKTGERLEAVSRKDVVDAAARLFFSPPRVILSVVPFDRLDLAVPDSVPAGRD
jgi:zinc protease